MLKEKKYKANDVVSVVLTTGQELIANLISEDMTTTTIKQPLSLVVDPQGNAGFQPFSMTGDSDGEVEIKNQQIISILKTRKEISSAYNTTTGGLVVPEQGLIRG